MVERLQKRLPFREEIADEKDDASPRDAFGDFMEHASHVGLAAGLQRVEPLKDAAHLRRFGLRGDEIAYLRVIRHEADGILLVDEKIRKRSGDVLPVLELRKPVRRRASAVGHRARSVEDDGRPQVRLVDILLDVEPLAARDELPVEIAEVVAGHIRTMFGELGAGAFARALVAAGDETVDGAVREELDSPELLQRRIRQPPHVSRQRHFRQPSPVRRQVPRGPARGRADA